METTPYAAIGPYLYHNGSDAVLVVSAYDWTVQEANPAAIQLIGMDPRKKSVPLSTILSRGDISVESALGQALHIHEVVHVPQGYWLQRRDQTPIAVDLVATRLPAETGGHYLLIARDTSPERRAQEAFEVLLGLSSNLLAIINPHGYFLRANPSWEACLGYPLAELTGMSIWDLIHPDDMDATVSVVKSLDREGLGEIENRVRHQDGNYRWLMWRMMMVDGAIHAAVQEKTEWKELENRLRQAQEAASAVERTKMEFFGTLSYELRTPLTAILGSTDLLLEEAIATGGSEGRAEHLRIIRRSALEMLEALNHVAQPMKLPPPDIDVDRVRCALPLLVQDVTALMRERALAKNQTLRVEYSGSIPESIETDTGRLAQILVHLLDDAISQRRSHGVVLRIGLKRNERSEPVILFDIVASGKPEPASPAAAGAPRERIGESGLGLAIGRKLAASLGGEMALDVREDRSTVRLTVSTGELEGVKIRDDLGPASGLPSAATAPTTLLGTHCRILLAEDGPDNLRILTAHLRKAGADVVGASDGRAAVELALSAQQQKQPFDLILMDMDMPVMDGYEATRQLRKNGYLRPIIALTAHAMQGDQEKCLEVGCNGYAAKPIDRGKLIQLISEHLAIKP